MLALMRLGSCCCKCKPPTTLKRAAGLIELITLLGIPLIITLAGNNIPMGPINKLVEPLGIGAKYGLFFIATPLGIAINLVIYKSWKSNERAATSARYENQDLPKTATVNWTKLVGHSYLDENCGSVKKEHLTSVIQVIDGKQFTLGKDGNYHFFFQHSDFTDVPEESVLEVLNELDIADFLKYQVRKADNLPYTSIDVIIKPESMDLELYFD